MATKKKLIIADIAVSVRFVASVYKLKKLDKSLESVPPICSTFFFIYQITASFQDFYVRGSMEKFLASR